MTDSILELIVIVKAIGLALVLVAVIGMITGEATDARVRVVIPAFMVGITLILGAVGASMVLAP